MANDKLKAGMRIVCADGAEGILVRRYNDRGGKWLAVSDKELPTLRGDCLHGRSIKISEWSQYGEDALTVATGLLKDGQYWFFISAREEDGAVVEDGVATVRKLKLRVTGDKTIGWKFFRVGPNNKPCSASGDNVEWAPGETKTLMHDTDIKACNFGFHMSPKIGQAMEYVDGNFLGLCEGYGEKSEESNKTAHRRMKLVKCWKVNGSHERSFAHVLAEKCGSHAKAAKAFDKYLEKV